MGVPEISCSNKFVRKPQSCLPKVLSFRRMSKHHLLMFQTTVVNFGLAFAPGSNLSRDIISHHPLSKASLHMVKLIDVGKLRAAKHPEPTNYRNEFLKINLTFEKGR